MPPSDTISRRCRRNPVVRCTAVIVIGWLLLAGCALIPIEPGAPHIPGSLGGDSSQIKTELYAHYDDWKTVRYRHGGVSKSGVDCSGFVYLTFHSRFGIQLPRSTSLQAKEGTQIMPRDLAAGDLVFFKTGSFTRHVGIYLEKGKFMHASTTEGVTISSMKKRYWKQCFWQARRI